MTERGGAPPKPTWNWPSVAGFLVALIGLIGLPWLFGPLGLALAAYGLRRATSDSVRYNVVPATIALCVALFVCLKGLGALGDLLMH